MTKTKIVIAGGGFGGLYAAKHFDKTLAITLRDVQALGDLAGRIRERRAQLIPSAASSPPEPAIRDQLK